jgi:TetR/AcrR family tetracycline transcriptional repressor
MPEETVTASRRPLTRERILEAAVGIIDEEGLEALSMRRLGAKLGVEAMSIYNHVPNKDALLQAVADHLISLTATPAEGTWKERLSTRLRSMRASLKQHPNTIPLLVRYHAHSTESFRVIEDGLGALRQAGFGPEETIMVQRVLSAFTIGTAVIESGEPIGGGVDEERGLPQVDLPLADFPCLHELRGYHRRCEFDETFERALEVILDGLEQRFLKEARNP